MGEQLNLFPPQWQGGLDPPTIEGITEQIRRNYKVVGFSRVEFVPFDTAGCRQLCRLVRQGIPA